MLSLRDELSLSNTILETLDMSESLDLTLSLIGIELVWLAVAETNGCFLTSLTPFDLIPLTAAAVVDAVRLLHSLLGSTFLGLVLVVGVLGLDVAAVG